MRARRAGLDSPPAVIPAHSLDAERAVLGAVMQDDAAGCLDQLRARGVMPETFYEERHRTVFRHLCALADAGRPTTLSTVVTSLRESEELDVLGGETAVKLIALDATVPALAADHADELVRLALKRAAERGGMLLTEHARNGCAPAELAAESRALAELLEGSSQPTWLDAAISLTGEGYRVSFPKRGLVMTFAAVRDTGEAIHADVAVSVHGEERDWASLNLSSSTARESRARKLTREVGGFPWPALLNTACRLVERKHREGEPAVALLPRPRTAAKYLFSPLLALGHPTVIHADGDSGKTTLAYAVALACYYGLPLPGFGPAPNGVRSLLLDYEGDEATAAATVDALARGFGEAGEGAIVYRRMTRPLAEDLPALRAIVAEHRIGLVVVDSLQPAVGGADGRHDPSEPYVRLFSALRSLGAGVTSLVLAHHSHQGDAQREAMPYGSRFIHNLCRVRFEIRADHTVDVGPPSLLAGLYHRKANYDVRRPPFAVRFVFDGDTTRVEAAQLRDSDTLMARAPMRQRVTEELQLGDLTATELAARLGDEPDSVRRWLERNRLLVAPRPGAKPQKWGLV